MKYIFGLITGILFIFIIAAAGDKITICHHADANAHTITIPASAWSAHEKHGDYQGECDEPEPTRQQPTATQAATIGPSPTVSETDTRQATPTPSSTPSDQATATSQPTRTPNVGPQVTVTPPVFYPGGELICVVWPDGSGDCYCPCNEGCDG